MKAQSLKNAILQLAVQGKLVPQNNSDEPASELLKKIKAEKAKLIKGNKIKAEKLLAPITDEEKPFDIPASWEWVRLGAVATNIHYGFTASALEKGNSRLLRITDIQDDKVDWTVVPYCEITEKEFVTYGLQNRDIMIARTGGTIGKSYIVRNLDGKSVFASYLIRVVPPTNINEEYLKSFFGSPCYWVQLKAKSMGTGQPNVNGTSLSELCIPIPPLVEQQRIVKKIEQLMPLVEQYDSYEKELSALEAKFPNDLKKAVLQFAVQGKLVPQNNADEPASELLKKIKAEKAKLIKEKKIKSEKPLAPITDEEKPFDIPDSWAWVRLGEITYSFGQKKPDKNFYYIDVGSINNLAGIIGDCSIVEPKDAPSRARKLVGDGCVIYSTVRPYLLNIAIVDNKDGKELIASTAFAIMQPFTGLYNKYLYHYLRSRAFVDFVNSQMIGVAYPAINDEKLFSGLLPLPPLAEQKRIVQKVEQILALCDVLADENKLKKHQPPKRLAKVIEFTPVETTEEHEHLFAARADEVSPETRSKEQERLALLRKKK